MKGLINFLILGILLNILGWSAVQAQTGEPIVGNVKIEFVDIRNVSDEAILARLEIREGMPYSQNLVDRSIRNLYNTRLFDYIEAATENLPNNQIEVIFTVQARY